MGVIADQGLAVTRGEPTTFRCTVSDLPASGSSGWLPVATLKLAPADETSDEPDPDAWADEIASADFTLVDAGGPSAPAVIDVRFTADAMLALRAGVRTAVLAVRDSVTRLGLVQPVWVDVLPDCE